MSMSWRAKRVNLTSLSLRAKRGNLIKKIFLYYYLTGLPRHSFPPNDKKIKGACPLFYSLSCGFFDFFDDSQECLGRMNGDVRKDLAVEGNIRLFQTVNETAVRHSIAFCCGFNPDDPQPPEIPLSSSSVPVRILKGSLHCFFGCAVIAAAGSPVAFGLF